MSNNFPLHGEPIKLNAHLYSKSLRPSQSEWSTPGFCHIWRIGSTSCAMAEGREGGSTLKNLTLVTSGRWVKSFVFRGSHQTVIIAETQPVSHTFLQRSRTNSAVAGSHAARQLTGCLFLLCASRRYDFIGKQTSGYAEWTPAVEGSGFPPPKTAGGWLQ